MRVCICLSLCLTLCMSVCPLVRGFSSHWFNVNGVLDSVGMSLYLGFFKQTTVLAGFYISIAG